MAKRKKLEPTPEEAREFLLMLQRQNEALQAAIAQALAPPILPRFEAPPEIQENSDLFKQWAQNPELRELSLPDALVAVRSIRSHMAKKAADGRRSRKRRSKYALEYPKWEEAALDVLHRAGSRHLTDKQVVSKVANWPGLRVDRRVLNTWWTNEGPRMRAEAQRRWPSPTRLFGSLKTAR